MKSLTLHSGKLILTITSALFCMLLALAIVGTGAAMVALPATASGNLQSSGAPKVHVGALTPTATAVPNCWSVVSSPNGGTQENYLNGVTVVSADDVWAVGSSMDSMANMKTLTQHWNGSSWSIISSPNAGSDRAYLTGVDAVSTDDVWAIGYSGGSGFQTLILHWDGSVWSVVASPNPVTSSALLESISVLSASDIWAVGSYYDATVSVFQTLILHWNGTTWAIVTSPNAGTNLNTLSGVAAISANDVWAVGVHGDGTSGFQTLTLHWDGSIWSVIDSPNGTQGSNALASVTALSANDVWAVGGFLNSSSVEQTLILHWDGTSWSIVASPNVGTGYNDLKGVSALSANDVWAVGTSEAASSSAIHLTLTLHWDGSAWAVVDSPNAGVQGNDLSAVAVASADDVWAVGSYYSLARHSYPTLIEHYNPCANRCTVSFEDVARGSTFYPYVQCLACQRLIDGYACGGTGEPCNGTNDPYFRPGTTITRGQFAKIAANAAGFDEATGAQQYEDVPVGSTFFDYIWRLSSRGYINGYPCGGAGEPCGTSGLPYFRPNANVTRGQIAKIDSNTAGYSETAGTQQYADLLAGSTFYDFVWRLSNRGLVSGYLCGGVQEPCDISNTPYFRPNTHASRGQASKIVSSTFFPDCAVTAR